MTPTELKPMTSAQTIDLKISQSTKIAKQVMKSELQKALVLAQEEIAVPLEALRALRTEWSTRFEKVLYSKVAFQLENDSAVNGLLVFLNSTTIPEEIGVKVGFENLISLINMRDPVNNLCGGILHGCKPPLLRKILADEAIQIIVKFTCEVSVAGRYRDCEFSVRVPLTTDILEIARKRLELILTHEMCLAEIKKLNSKLANIDTITEELEAGLLVTELRKSLEGREVLDLTTEIVTEMLGETPNLLGTLR